MRSLYFYLRRQPILTPLPSIKLHFKDHKGNSIKTIEASEGDDVLSLAHEWDIDLEGECSTPDFQSPGYSPLVAHLSDRRM